MPPPEHGGLAAPSTTGVGRRGRRLAALLVGVALALSAGWAAVAPLPAGPREQTYVFARGTAARQAAGEATSALPGRLRFTIGVRDVLVLRNEDEAPAAFGPVLLAPGQTYRVPFRSPGAFQLSCSAHASGQIDIEVVPRPSPGLHRLLWRIEHLRERLRPF